MQRQLIFLYMFGFWSELSVCGCNTFGCRVACSFECAALRYISVVVIRLAGAGVCVELIAIVFIVRASNFEGAIFLSTYSTNANIYALSMCGVFLIFAHVPMTVDVCVVLYLRFYPFTSPHYFGQHSNFTVTICFFSLLIFILILI